MKSYRLDELEIGMIIAEDMVLFDGMIMIKSGIELDETILEIFKKQNISSVFVQEPIDHSKIFSNEEIEKMKTEIEEQKKLLFRDCIEDEYMSALFLTVCNLRLLESMDG
ncbi:MAG: hypothetical protein FWG98_01690 [Candidatus Cloacimonetes bacterium]|nr:hypothetical protein [Candidatus Cloacimonadota bacterium]